MKIIAIMEWDIKERAFRLIEADVTSRAKRIMRQRFKDKKGNVVSCVADFGGGVPSEEQLRAYLQREKTRGIAEERRSATERS